MRFTLPGAILLALASVLTACGSDDTARTINVPGDAGTIQEAVDDARPGDIVLIAGGKNKGLDLSEMASDIERIRAVVATGAAGPDVAAAFAGRRPVRSAATMREAVEHARELARPGDVVLLSPGCTSYDWYRNYGERGDDFRRIVTELAATTITPTATPNHTSKGKTTT